MLVIKTAKELQEELLQQVKREEAQAKKLLIPGHRRDAKNRVEGLRLALTYVEALVAHEEREGNEHGRFS